MHPSGRKSDLNESYEAWKKRERTMLNQLIIGLANTHPEFAARPTPEHAKTLFQPTHSEYQSQEGGRPRSSSISQSVSPYTFIPNDPREYYRFLVSACLVAEVNAGISDSRLLGTKSTSILKECGLRWRLMPTFRIIAYYIYFLLIIKAGRHCS